LQRSSEKQKKGKEKAEGAQKRKREKKAAPKKKKEQEKNRKWEKSEEKFRSACILLSLCAELYCSLLELGPGRV